MHNGLSWMPSTGLFLNGRAWKGWSEERQLGYLLGAADGIRLGLPAKFDDQAKHSKNYFCIGPDGVDR